MKDPTDRKTMDLLASSKAKERPLLFSAPMVRAILEGRKTQTRRALKIQPLDILPMKGKKKGIEWIGLKEREPEPRGLVFRCRYGVPGDRLWVRESFADLLGTGIEHRVSNGRPQRYAYAADTKPGSYGDQSRKDYGVKWTPSIHMPRNACRIVLQLTGVRIERLQDISESDAAAEGVESEFANAPFAGTFGSLCGRQHRYGYQTLWDSLNAKRGFGWDSNPWVWVVEFKRV